MLIRRVRPLSWLLFTMKIFLLYLLILFHFSISAHASDISARIIAPTELSIYTVSIGDSERTVLAKLGPPKYKRNSEKGAELNYFDFMELTVLLTPGKDPRVMGLASTKYCLPSKVCPKQPLKNATNILGSTRTLDVGNSSITTYITESPRCKVRMTSKKSIIEDIFIYCE